MSQPARSDSPVSVFVSLEPDRELADRISGLKQQVRKLVGEQLYLSDPPHLTVYLAVYGNQESFRERWPLAFDQIAPLPLELAGWRVFYADALTGRNTLVCEIAEQGQQRLRSLQEHVIAQLAPGRDRPLTERRYAARWEALDDAQRQQIRETGFPYIGAGWLPHFTIASIDTGVWPHVWETVEHHALFGSFTCSRLQPYLLVHDRPEPLSTCTPRP